MKVGDIVYSIDTNAKLQIIEILNKEFLREQEAKCLVLESTIEEDIGEVFEYELRGLSE